MSSTSPLLTTDTAQPQFSCAKPVPRATVENHSARRINVLAEKLGAKSYLEIGVYEGETFRAVRIERLVGVDKQFRFDTKTCDPDTTRLFQMTSDEYFVKEARNDIFDIIFVDALHTFEQCLRDCNNALMVSHARTVWVIDDTVPSDVYSAWPVAAEAVQRRKEAGIESAAWHGDVYKVIFAIHDFFPLLSFATITTGGNPQTVVWREPRGNFKQRYGSLETISRLSWFEFRREFALLNPVEEEAGLQMVVRALGV